MWEKIFSCYNFLSYSNFSFLLKASEYKSLNFYYTASLLCESTKFSSAILCTSYDANCYDFVSILGLKVLLTFSAYLKSCASYFFLCCCYFANNISLSSVLINGSLLQMLIIFGLNVTSSNSDSIFKWRCCSNSSYFNFFYFKPAS